MTGALTSAGFFLGGLALFLLGMETASDALKQTAGGRLRAMVTLFTANRFMALGAGILVTLFLSSSSAATVLFVGLANAGLLTLAQSIGLMLGAAIGTTLTVQIIAFKVTKFALVLIAGGYLVRWLSKYQPGKHAGALTMGVGFVFYGMHLMQQGAAPIQDFAAGRQLVSLLNDPVGGFLAGLLLTAVIQSSAAAIGGLVMPLAVSGALSGPAALPVVVGANVGTCVTALLGSLAGSLRGKQVAVGHLLAKTAGAVVVLMLVGPISRLCDWLTSALGTESARRMVANEHLVFNIVVVLLVLPVAGPFARLLEHVMGRRRGVGKGVAGRLDGSALADPERALMLAHREVLRMTGPVRSMLSAIPTIFEEDDERLLQDTTAMDDKVDLYQEVIETYVSRLDPEMLTPETGRMRSKLLLVTAELERIGDVVSLEIDALARRKIRLGSAFSVEGHVELRAFTSQVMDGYDRMMSFLAGKPDADPTPVLRHESRIEQVKRGLEEAHTRRVARGIVEAELTGRIYPDLLSALRLVHYHIARIVHGLLGYRAD